LARRHFLLNRLIHGADERTRRLLAGFFALQFGRGGITLVARITALSPHTIRRGLRELRKPSTLSPERVRRCGAGRKPVEVVHPKSASSWKASSRTTRREIPSRG
jgi:hypothetical protein